MLDLQTIKARAEAATPGPWVQREEVDGHDWRTRIELPATMPRVVVARTDRHHGRSHVQNAAWEPNAEFIAHAREDVPALVAEVERLQESLRHLVNTCYGAPRSVWDVALASLAVEREG